MLSKLLRRTGSRTHRPAANRAQAKPACRLRLEALEDRCVLSADVVLHWNEILLELVARADLPPAPNPDGTYPVPDAANPFAYPTFPFGNPPYAARAYSYVTVGASAARAELAQPIEDTLFFAGEATDAEEGTVTGALQSGVRAAREVLAAAGVQPYPGRSEERARPTR